MEKKSKINERNELSEAIRPCVSKTSYVILNKWMNDKRDTNLNKKK